MQSSRPLKLFYFPALNLALKKMQLQHFSFFHTLSWSGLNQNTSSWGGSILNLPGAEKNQWVMFAAEMTHGCTLRHWTTNSEVVMVCWLIMHRSLHALDDTKLDLGSSINTNWSLQGSVSSNPTMGSVSITMAFSQTLGIKCIVILQPTIQRLLSQQTDMLLYILSGMVSH